MRLAVLPFALSLLLAAPAFAQTAASAPAGAAPPVSATAVTLEQAMADPDWIGPPVEPCWWAGDSRRAQYTLTRAGSTVRDTYRQAIDGGAASRVDGAARSDLDATQPVYDPARTRMAFVRYGDVFVRDLRSGALTQVTRSNAIEALPQWSRDGNLVFRVDNEWYQWRAGSGVSQASAVKAEKDPDAAPKADDLRKRQLAMIPPPKDDRAPRHAAREQDEAWRRSDATRAPTPVYLGADVSIADSALSPDGRWLLVVTQAKDAEAGQAGKMPKYVTESG